MKFAKLLRTLFLLNTSGRLLLKGAQSKKKRCQRIVLKKPKTKIKIRSRESSFCADLITETMNIFVPSIITSLLKTVEDKYILNNVQDHCATKNKR